MMQDYKVSTSEVGLLKYVSVLSVSLMKTSTCSALYTVTSTDSCKGSTTRTTYRCLQQVLGEIRYNIADQHLSVYF